MNKQFDHLKGSVLIIQWIFISTHPQFNVLSGGLTECLEEPRHVGVSTAGSLLTNTLLPIPQGVIGEETKGPSIPFIIIASFTVVVTTNIGRNLSCTCTFIIAGTNESCWLVGPFKINTISISPDVIAGSTPICDGHTMNIEIINSQIIVDSVFSKCFR